MKLLNLVPEYALICYYSVFELSCGRVVTRVYVTTTGDKVYGFLPRESEQGKI
jgi:hypothetical protein